MYHVAGCKQDGQAKLDELSKTAAHPHKLQQQYAMIESSVKGCGCHVCSAAHARMPVVSEASMTIVHHGCAQLTACQSYRPTLMPRCLMPCSAGRVLPGFVELLAALPQHPDAHAAFGMQLGAPSHAASPLSQRGTPVGSPRGAPLPTSSRCCIGLAA